jgi:hypothetical protein
LLADVKRLLREAGCLISYHVYHRMPSTAQHEVTIPVEVLVVQSDANGLFQKTVYIARLSVQNDGVAEVDTMSCVVFHHRRLVRLIETDVSPVFLHLVSMDLPVWRTYALLHSQ